MLTGRGGASGGDTAQQYPFFGSIAGKVRGPRKPGMPANVCVPYAMSIGLRPGYFGGHYLGVEHNPFETEGDPNADNFQVTNISPVAGLTLDRLSDRRTLNRISIAGREVDAADRVDADGSQFDAQAFDLVTGSAAREGVQHRVRDAGDARTLRPQQLGPERAAGAPAGRSRIDGRHLSLRRLGHALEPPGRDGTLPAASRPGRARPADRPHERGILDKTLVMVCGEFSRTPRMNDGGNGGPPLSQGTPGRDHWGLRSRS